MRPSSKGKVVSKIQNYQHYSPKHSKSIHEIKSSREVTTNLPNLTTMESQEVIVTNSPIVDGTVFIARTGNQDHKMVVLREEYYRKLVDLIQREQRAASQREQMTGFQQRSSSFKSRPMNLTERSLNSIRTTSVGLAKKPPIQRASSLRALRTTEIKTSQTNIDMPYGLNQPKGVQRLSDIAHKRSNSERILKLPDKFRGESQPRYYGREQLLSPRPSSEIRTTRTQLLRELSS